MRNNYRYMYEVTKISIDIDNVFSIGEQLYFYSKQPKRIILNDRNLKPYVDIEVKLIKKEVISRETMLQEKKL